MTTIRQFTCDDFYRFNNINLDALTETYSLNFYLQYLAKWPEYIEVAQHPSGRLMGYNYGKVEGQNTDWHGHVTALTVAPEFRRLQLGAKFMENLENVSEHQHNGYFVDLFVRKSNVVAIAMYRALGYIVYREVIGYYGGGGGSDGDDCENAYDMRKALPRDKDKKSMVPLPHPVYPNNETM